MNHLVYSSTVAESLSIILYKINAKVDETNMKTIFMLCVVSVQAVCCGKGYYYYPWCVSP